jgi:nucleotide-binding universal stress UspA family protein
VVGSQRDRRDPAVASAVDAALLGRGRPVFVAGPRAQDNDFRRLLVAWNGSVEAARAVSAALPFLCRAETVTLAATESETGETPVTAGLAEFLLCHGVQATTRLLDAHRPAAEALCELAASADLLVMGAYTHGRLWQLIVGGVTRHLLRASPVPLLMAH